MEDKEKKEKQDCRKKVVIFGGTFDPIHTGHLFIAESCLEKLGVSEVWFMPSGKPPHKRNREELVSGFQRAEMIRRAIKEYSHFKLRLDDMEREGYSYTYKLMQRLTRRYPDYSFYFLIGADSLMDFGQWVEPGRIMECCTLVVAMRNGFSFEKLLEESTRLKERYGGDIILLQDREIPVSSSDIRKMISNGQSAAEYLPKAVAQYIESERLYHS